MNIIDEIAEEHAQWMATWVAEIPPPADHDEFVRLMMRMYRDAFIHGFKHGYDRALLEHKED